MRMVHDGRTTGGRGRECRSLLSIIGMIVADGFDDVNCNIVKASLYRTVFASLSRQAAQRLVTRSGKQRKRLEREELKEFRCVEEDAKR